MDLAIPMTTAPRLAALPKEVPVRRDMAEARRKPSRGMALGVTARVPQWTR